MRPCRDSDVYLLKKVDDCRLWTALQMILAENYRSLLLANSFRDPRHIKDGRVRGCKLNHQFINSIKSDYTCFYIVTWGISRAHAAHFNWDKKRKRAG